MEHAKKPFTVLHGEELVEMNFDQMYKKFKRPVENFILKKVKGDVMLAEELTNDVFVKALKNIAQYKSEFAITTWIFNIAKNLVIDYVRKKNLNTMSIDSVYVEWLNGEEAPQTDRLIQLNDSANNPEEKMISDEVMKTMYARFKGLNESEKMIATMHFFDGLSYAEVAEQLAMPLGTVKARLSRARKVMMEALPVEMRNAVKIPQ
jgi:RNA polymerase sigma-70 factor (ECF subfamily)